MSALLHTDVSTSLFPQDVASKQSLCMLDTANTSTKVFEDVGWINIARFFGRMFGLIKFIIAFLADSGKKKSYLEYLKWCKIF